jgi:two-component system KDP operon response regulator KdpE
MTIKAISDEGLGVKVLVVDDEPEIVRLVSIQLRRRGYQIPTAANAAEALELAEAEKPDVILLDINMPGLDGISSIPDLRRVCNATIIMVSSLSASRIKVEALDRGADDYLVKPFDLEELVARLRVAVRHNRALQNNAYPGEAPVIADNFLRIDLNQRLVERQGEYVRLSRLEYSLISLLVLNLNKTLSRREILQKVWGIEYGDETDILRTLIKQVRRKIEPDPANPRYLLTEGRTGYRFVLPLL